MRKIVEDTDLNLIADEILSNVRMLELSDEDSAEMDLDIYLPKIRRAAEDLNSIAANSEPAKEARRHESAYSDNPGDPGRERTGTGCTVAPEESNGSGRSSV